MKCPACQATNPEGQKFCGACGHTLEMACARCQASNPPHYKFCGQCGANLSGIGAITLARSGLITQVNAEASALLGYQQSEMQGKSFSLFIKRPDLVVFFSHWNELLSKGAKQSFEIALNHKAQKSICVRLESSIDPQPARAIEAIRLALTEITDSRLAAAQVQTQQEMLGLTLSIANHISTVGATHVAQAIEEALKKICLFTKADLARIHAFNRSSNRLESVFQWHHPSVTSPQDNRGPKFIPLSKVKDVLIRLRQEKTVVVDDVAQLAPSEQSEWHTWFPDAPGAVICHLIYSGAAPVGVIGVAKARTSDKWTPDCVGLVRFLGDLVADRLPAGKVDPDRRSRTGAGADVIDADVPRPQSGARAKRASAESTPRKRKQPPTSMPRPMSLEKFSGAPAEDQQPVFPRDDGLVLLTCPGCGFQETASVERLDLLGKTIGVGCACGRRFVAVLEKRRFFRKPVRLEGYFSVGGDLGPIGADGQVWGTMVVKDLSRAGLRFSAAKTHLLHPGDLLMVRFNLDNTNQALIHKPARVISVTGNGVGCLFEGADNYDITLGFYLM